jgi:hypothetical protein
MADRSGTKQWINSRPAAVFASAFGDKNCTLFDQQVVIRRSDVDSAWLESLSIFSQFAAKGFMFPQLVQQGLSGALGRHVLNDEDGDGQIGWQLADEIIQSFPPAEVPITMMLRPLPGIRFFLSACL